MDNTNQAERGTESQCSCSTFIAYLHQLPPATEHSPMLQSQVVISAHPYLSLALLQGWGRECFSAWPCICEQSSTGAALCKAGGLLPPNLTQNVPMEKEKLREEFMEGGGKEKRRKKKNLKKFPCRTLPSCSVSNGQ